LAAILVRQLSEEANIMEGRHHKNRVKVSSFAIGWQIKYNNNVSSWLYWKQIVVNQVNNTAVYGTHTLAHSSIPPFFHIAENRRSADENNVLGANWTSVVTVMK